MESQARLDEIAGALVDVQAQVGALAQEPRDHGLDEAIAAVASRVDELGAEVRDDGGTSNRLDQLDEAFADVRRQLAAIADQQNDRSSDEAIQALARRLDEVAALADEDDRVTGRLDELSDSLTELRAQFASLTEAHRDSGHDHEAVAALASRIDELVAGLTERSVEPDGRIDELAHAVTELRAEIATLADPSREHDVHEAVRSLADRIDELAVPPDDGAVTNRLDTIERQRATDAETIDVLLLALDRIREDLSERHPARAEHSGENDGRLDELDRAFAEVQAQLASLDERPSDPGFEERLAGLAARVEAIDTAAPQTLEADPRIDVLVQSLAELRDELSSVAARSREQGADETLAMLAARVDEIASAPPPAPGGRSADRRARAFRLRAQGRPRVTRRPAADHTADEALALLTARVEEIAATPPRPTSPIRASTSSETRLPSSGAGSSHWRCSPTSRPTTDARGPDEPGRRARVGPSGRRRGAAAGDRAPCGAPRDLSRDLEARLAVADPAGAEAIDETVPEQLERVRLSIERFGLHLGEHDRALATSCAAVASSAASKSSPSASISSLRPRPADAEAPPVPRPPASRPTCSRWREGSRRQRLPRRRIARSSCHASRSSALRSTGACSVSKPTTRRSTARGQG